jgi:hypothetical protein
MNRPVFRASAVFLAGLFTLGIIIAGCGRNQQNGQTDPTPAAAEQAVAAPVGTEDVLTYHNDNARTGQYLNEQILTKSNVNVADFGKVGFLRVQGRVDAEPLYVSNVKIAGGGHRVVFVVTEHGLAYAFDADNYSQLWKATLVGVDETTSDTRNCGQVAPEIGVTSTPVIDVKAGPHGTIYIVAMSKDHHGKYFQRLHALDLASGAELAGSPQTISASFPGTGAGSKNGNVIFDPKQYEDRAALLLANGAIYTTWSSHCDEDPYTGWVIAYSGSTLKQTAVLNLTPNGNEGSTWMSGDGPAADSSGNIYLLTANGTFETSLDQNRFPSHGDFGNAFVKIAASGNKLSVTDYFTMHDTISESNTDEDLGSGGIILLPDLKDNSGQNRHLAVGAGKDQIIYVADRDSLGKFNPNTDKIYQEIPGALAGLQFATPAYFNNVVYYGAVRDSLKAFPVMNARVANAPTSQTTVKFEYPGTTPSVSADGISNGIVWAVEPGGTAGNSDELPGFLHAYDAANLAKELYGSAQSGAGAKFEDNKFITPMIAGGKVFVGTPTGVIVFGLLKGVSAPAKP